jgi:hypothetical protein
MVDTKLNLPDLPTSPMFIGDDRVMTIEWQEFFRNLFNRVGGIVGPSITESDLLTVSESYSTPISYFKEINELKKTIETLPKSKSYDKEIATLEKLILAISEPKPGIKGPFSSTDNAIARWNGINGNTLQDSEVTIDDSDNITVPSLTANQLVKTDVSKVLTSTIGTVQVPIVMDMFDAIPSRGSASNWHGGLLSLAVGQPLDTVPTDIVVTKGHGKIIIVVNAGGDLDGEITVTGDSVDRNTGVITPADTDIITVDALTTDNTITDANGNIVHTFIGAYITSKWFTGTVTLSTVDLALTDVDVYHCSFEQSNDSPNLVINTFDANIFTTGVSAEFDAYLQTIHVTGDKCNVDNEAELHVGTIGETAIADKYWRLRQGEIDEDLDGLTDGFFVQVFYKGTPIAVEDVTISVWLTKTIIVELS